MQQLRALDLAGWLNDPARKPPVLLDVREDWEVEMCSLPGITHIPMHLVPERASEMDRDAELVVICHHGVRSMQVAMFLERKGYGAVYNLMGGVEAWAGEVDSTMRRY